MPTLEHELVAEMFRNRPEITTELLGHLGCSLPKSDGAEVISADFNDIKPTEYRADVTIKRTIGGKPAYAVIVEAQRRPDKRKRYSWPVYVTTLHARLKCPVFLLVTCPNARVARGCAQPIVIGAEWFLTMSPMVLDLKKVPKITDEAVAERLPELAVLSAVAHGGKSGSEPVLKACVAAFRSLEDDHLALYYDFVVSALPGWARAFLRSLMSIVETYRPRSDWGKRLFRNGKAEGRAEGEAEALLTVLEARGFDLPDDVRARITGCTDTEQLNAWVRQAVTIDKVDELFS